MNNKPELAIAQIDGRWIVIEDNDDQPVSFKNALSVHETYEEARKALEAEDEA